MSGKFWLFWLMTIPTTGLVVGTWVLYHKHAEKRFKLGSITEYKSK
jgi:hypothetical protein